MVFVDMPKVSVIMIFYNAAAFMEEALQSIIAQTFHDWELILVDDGSTDLSREIAARAVALQPEKICLLWHPDNANQGMSVSRNTALMHARGELVAFLDADDVWLPEMLDTYITKMISAPEAGMVYGNTTYWRSWNNGADSQPKAGVSYDSIYQEPELLERFLANKSAVPSMCSLMVKRDVLLQVNGFDDEFTGLYEDQVIYAKMALSTPVMPIEDNLALYRQHENSTVSAAKATGQEAAGRLRFLQWLKQYSAKHPKNTTMLLLLIEREIWCYQLISNSTFPPMAKELLRFANKFLIKLEARWIPLTIRLRIWERVLRKNQS